MEHHTIALHMRRTSLDDICQLLVEGIGKSNVTHDTTLKEGEWPDALGAIDDLVGDHKVHGLNLLLQGAHGREGNDASDAEVAESSDVGLVGNFMRRKLMVQAVAGEEGNVDAVVGEDGDGRGGRSPRGDGVDDSNGLVAVELGKAGATDDGNVDGLYMLELESHWRWQQGALQHTVEASGEVGHGDCWLVIED